MDSKLLLVIIMKKDFSNVFIIIGIIILTLCIIFACISFIYDNNNYNDETQASISQVKLLDRHITIDNEYEILYSITYTNGLALQVWHEVNYNDYITLWEENRYDESAFIN